MKRSYSNADVAFGTIVKSPDALFVGSASRDGVDEDGPRGVSVATPSERRRAQREDGGKPRRALFYGVMLRLCCFWQVQDSCEVGRGSGY